ncbi:MAG: hypothetical protein ACT4OO_10735 [Nitrospiraceae bacterium]
MRPYLFIKMMFAAVTLVALWFICTPAVFAADLTTDLTIGPKMEITHERLNHDVTTSEPGTGELGRGTEQPMKVPDSEPPIDLKDLKGPEPSDVERARESDIQSSVSF